MNEIDVLLEPVGDSRVPHRGGDEIAVSGDEAVSDGEDFVPCSALRLGVLLAGEDGHLRCCLVAIECGQVGVPQFEGVDFKVRVDAAQRYLIASPMWNSGIPYR